MAIQPAISQISIDTELTRSPKLNWTVEVDAEEVVLTYVDTVFSVVSVVTTELQDHGNK